MLPRISGPPARPRPPARGRTARPGCCTLACRMLAAIALLLAATLQASWSVPPSANPPHSAAIPPPTPVSSHASIEVQGAPRQGGALFLTVRDAVHNATTRIHWLNRDWPVGVEDEDEVRTVVPIAVYVKPGVHELALYTDGKVVASASVRVVKHAYPHGEIRLPRAMLATYLTPRARAEDRRILDAAAVFLPRRYWHGNFVVPAAGPLGTRFGIQRTYNGWYHAYHHGIDIEAWGGSAIRAANAGVVTVVSHHMLVNGSATLINHGFGVSSLYLHQSHQNVRPGQSVWKGEVIGRVGMTGAGTGPHLHWACYVDGIPVDPEVLMHVPTGW